METYNPHKNPHVPKPLETLATNMILYIYIYDYIRQCLWGNADE
jgi:hypothetical protein